MKTRGTRTMLAYVLVFALAVLLAVFCTLHEEQFLDKAICKIGTATYYIPSFWLGVVLVLIFSVVHSQARITELNGQINDTRTGLTAAQSEYDYLSTKMSDITSRASLQDVAEGQLGLVKADQSQITYIQLEEQSVIEKTGSDAGRVLVGIRTAALNLLDSFNP